MMSSLCLGVNYFCNACREELHIKRSTVKNDIRSTKYAEANTKLSMKEAREQDIAIALKTQLY